MKSTVHAALNKEFDGIIWHIRIDQIFSRLTIEVRNVDQYNVRYVQVDLKTFQFRSVPTPNQVDWFSTLLGTFGDKIIFTHYADEKNPGPSTLIIWDDQQQQEVSRIEQCMVSSINGPKIEGSVMSQEGRENVEIDLREGDHSDLPEINEMKFPAVFRTGEKDHQVIVDYLDVLGLHPVLDVEYLEDGHDIFLTYYTGSGRTLDKHLIWIKDENIVLHQQIDKNLKGVSFESFLTYKKLTIFVRNRNELCIYER